MVEIKMPKSFHPVQLDRMVERAIEKVCEAENLDPRIFRSGFRGREYTDVRQIYLYVMYDRFKNFGLSLYKVGKTVNRDHATVCHAKEAVTDRMDVYPEYVGRVKFIEDIIDAAIRPWMFPNTREYLHTEIYKLKQKIESYEQELRELDEMDQESVCGGERENARPVEHGNDSVGDIS